MITGQQESILEYSRPRVGCLRSLLILFVIVLLCSGSSAAFLDIRCGLETTWLQPYPGSQLVSQEYNFLRPHGMGVTLSVYRSPDSAEAIRDWYGDQCRPYIEQNTAQLAETRFDITNDPQSDQRLITLSSVCAWNPQA